MSQPESTPELRSWSLLVVLVLLTFLVWEWLRPLPLLSDTHTVHLFLLFFIAVLVVRFFRLPWYVHLFLIGFLMLFFVHRLYFQLPFLSKEWLTVLQEDVLLSLSLVWERQWGDISFLSRTLSFFLLLWYAAVYLFKTAVLKQRIMSFVLLTVICLAVLDTFTAFEGSGAIIRTFVLGFVLLAFLQMVRIRGQVSKGGSALPGSFPYFWLAVSMVVILVAASIAYAAPKADPAWPDPVPFISHYAETGGDGWAADTVQRSGYGESDEVLGGSFVQDDSIVFRAVTEASLYWRGESKDIYTGHGWESTEEEEHFISAGGQLASSERVGKYWEEHASLYAPRVERETLHSTVRFEEHPLSRIFYPGDIHSLSTSPQSGLGLFPLSGKLVAREGAQKEHSTSLEGYQLEYSEPTFSTPALRESDMERVPDSIREKYTQLPDSLPERVEELAAEETQGLETAFEQVKHIESFFKRNDFQYNIADIPVPDAGDDFVDQFLFETRHGYCDHFSTSMVVMLRTLDIPARWVKGFTAGEMEYEGDGQFSTVVRNRNAHSWVEVYFPDVGWVPFEPTRTFSSPFSFAQDELGDRTNEETGTEDGSPEQEAEDGETHEEDGMSVGSQPDQGNSIPERMLALNGLKWVVPLAGIVLASLGLVVLYFIRKCNRRMPQREGSQTLREYVLGLEADEPSTELRRLTQVLEASRYGPDADAKNDLRKINKLWSALMKKTKKRK